MDGWRDPGGRARVRVGEENFSLGHAEFEGIVTVRYVGLELGSEVWQN